MPTYAYSAMDRDTGRETQGTIQAETRALAAQQLRARDLLPMALREETGEKGDRGGLTRSVSLPIRRVRRKHLVPFTRQLATLIEAGMPLVYIPPGEFLMGSDSDGENEKPAHHAYLEAFYIGRFPVTNWQYHEFVRDTGQEMPPYIQKIGYNEPDQPVVGVPWHDALDFCKWFSRKAKKNYALPTEAQWEKAARGVEGNRYPWGSEKPSPEKAHFLHTYSRKSYSGLDLQQIIAAFHWK